MSDLSVSTSPFIYWDLCEGQFPVLVTVSPDRMTTIKDDRLKGPPLMDYEQLGVVIKSLRNARRAIRFAEKLESLNREGSI